jgi:hypothetical protein
VTERVTEQHRGTQRFSVILPFIHVSLCLCLCPAELSPEEASKRQKQLQKLRMLESYYEAKFKRVAKIKSKKYHKIKNKVRWALCPKSLSVSQSIFDSLSLSLSLSLCVCACLSLFALNCPLCPSVCLSVSVSFRLSFFSLPFSNIPPALPSHACHTGAEASGTKESNT